MSQIARVIAIAILTGSVAGCDDGARSGVMIPQSVAPDVKSACADPAPLTGSAGEAGALFENYELILKIQTNGAERDRIIKELEMRHDRAFSPMMGKGKKPAGWWASLGREKGCSVAV